MGVHPGPSVVRAKGFLTGEVDRRRDHNPNGSVLVPWLQGCTSLRRSPERSILTNNGTPPVRQESLEVRGLRLQSVVRRNGLPRSHLNFMSLGT
jgi:hypothetical protein